MLKERVGYFCRDIIGLHLPEKKYNIVISDETRERITEIKQTIENNKELSLLYYGNHNTKGEPLLLGYTTELIDPERTRHLVSVVSYDHTDKKKLIKNGLTLAMYQLVRWCGVETIQVVQTDENGKPTSGHTMEEVGEYYRKLITRLGELRESNKPVGLIIFPEGHRSEDGNLQKAKYGIARVVAELAPIMCIPVGIIFKDGQRSSLNFGKEVEINIGKTYTIEKEVRIHKKNTTDLLMQNLADTLPIQMRGPYPGTMYKGQGEDKL